MTKLIEKASGAKLVYIPFKSGGEADVQLSGGHVDSHVNNPSESIGNWRAGKVRPLCVFSPSRLAAGPKVTADFGWSDIPTCKSEGLAIDHFTQPRVVWMPGKVPAEAAAYYIEILKKVSETAEWKEYLEPTSQSGRFIGGEEFKKFVAADHDRFRSVFAEQGWLVK